jgi:hypothetical protein
MDKEVLVMNSNYDITEMPNISVLSGKVKNREVDTTANNEMMQMERQALKEKIQDAVMMDLSEVKNFLFMLIGAEVKVKPENVHSGSLINRLV